jgi:hypothetical protein
MGAGEGARYLLVLAYVWLVIYLWFHLGGFHVSLLKLQHPSNPVAKKL